MLLVFETWAFGLVTKCKLASLIRYLFKVLKLKFNSDEDPTVVNGESKTSNLWENKNTVIGIRHIPEETTVLRSGKTNIINPYAYEDSIICIVLVV